jgi:hypothetical protein
MYFLKIFIFILKLLFFLYNLGPNLNTIHVFLRNGWIARNKIEVKNTGNISDGFEI